MNQNTLFITQNTLFVNQMRVKTIFTFIFGNSRLFTHVSQNPCIREKYTKYTIAKSKILYLEPCNLRDLQKKLTPIAHFWPSEWPIQSTPLIGGHQRQLNNRCKDPMINNRDCRIGQLTTMVLEISKEGMCPLQSQFKLFIEIRSNWDAFLSLAFFALNCDRISCKRAFLSSKLFLLFCDNVSPLFTSSSS